MLFLMGPSIVLLLILGIALGVGIALLAVYIYNKMNPNSTENVMIRGLKANAVEFYGLYEPAYMVSLGQSSRMQRATFAAWNERVNACPDDGGFKYVFNHLFGGYETWGRERDGHLNIDIADAKFTRKAKKLMKYIRKAEIERAEDTFIYGNAKNIICYEQVGGSPIEEGIHYEVLSPYWRFGTLLMNKGVAK